MKHRIISKLVIGIIMLKVSSIAIANNGWQFSGSKLPTNSDFNDKSLDAFIDDVLPEEDMNKIVLTDQELKTARVWAISEYDMKRYKALMANKSGNYYKNKELSPIEVLGINARDNTEREYFASLLVKANSQRFAKELAFEKVYNNTYRNYINNQKLPIVRQFDTDKYSPFNYKAINLEDGDNLMLFIREKDASRRITGPLISEVMNNGKIQLNIYLMDKDLAKESVFNWAKKNNIPSELVSNKKITLNVGFTGFKNINANEQTPALYLIRGRETSSIDLSRF